MKCMFSPQSLGKNLTPTLLKTRRRFETMSAVSNTESEGECSPLWECEEIRAPPHAVIQGGPQQTLSTILWAVHFRENTVQL